MAWDRSVAWLRQAVAAARELGPGTELFRAAFGLASVAPRARTAEDAVALGDEAWAAIEEASPFLLLDRTDRETEAAVATEVALQLAARLASEGIAIAAAGTTFVLRAERAEVVLRWMQRAHEPLRRPLKARLAAPAGIPMPLWQDWLAAIERGDARALVAPLKQIREIAPDFLAGERIEGTWRWL